AGDDVVLDVERKAPRKIGHGKNIFARDVGDGIKTRADQVAGLDAAKAVQPFGDGEIWIVVHRIVAQGKGGAMFRAHDDKVEFIEAVAVNGVAENLLEILRCAGLHKLP